MIASGSLSNYANSIFDINVSVNSPLSGFELSLTETGAFYSANLITFSGKEGYLFDQSGNFFGGYQSGVSFNLKVHYDYTDSTFSYYHNDVLAANGLDVTGFDCKGATDGAVNCVDFVKHQNSSVTVVASGETRESLAKHATSQINNRITSSMDITTNGSMLTGFTDPNGDLDGGGFNVGRSEEFWGKNVDFTAVSVWNNEGYGGAGTEDFRMRAATAITKRHVIMAKHFPVAASKVIYFVDPDGNWISRTVSAIASHGSADITVGTLNEDLPDDITPVKVIPSNINEYFRRNTTTDAVDSSYRPIAAGFDHQKKALLMQITNMDNAAGLFTFFANPATLFTPYSNLAETLESGDSGNPCFLIVDGEAVLIGTFYTTASGPSIASYISAINTLITSADSSAGVSTNLTVTPFDLGKFPIF